MRYYIAQDRNLRTEELLETDPTQTETHQRPSSNSYLDFNPNQDPQGFIIHPRGSWQEGWDLYHSHSLRLRNVILRTTLYIDSHRTTLRSKPQQLAIQNRITTNHSSMYLHQVGLIHHFLALAQLWWDTLKLIINHLLSIVKVSLTMYLCPLKWVFVPSLDK